MNRGRNKPSGVFKAGAVSLAFIVLGFQAALFVHKAAVERIVSVQEKPDTVYVVDRRLAAELLGADKDDTPQSGVFRGALQKTAGGDIIIRKRAGSSPQAKEVKEKIIPRKVENFVFDPNTASVEDLVRLGFSPRQAQSIDNYRKKGGRFRRKGDFAKSFVVSDSVYRRLEPYISIPKIDINRADSAAFETLPGIGPWYAAKMVEYRERLHGYSAPEQLMEIYRFDSEKYDALKDLITCSPAEPYPFWSAPADSLRLHPHINSWNCAKAIVFYREHNSRDKWTVEGLLAAGIISDTQAARLKLCKLK